jgi:hypothetical protein
MKSGKKNLFDKNNPVFVYQFGTLTYYGLKEVTYNDGVFQASPTMTTSYANSVVIPYKPYSKLTISFDLSLAKNFRYKYIILSELPNASGGGVAQSYLSGYVTAITVSGNRQKVTFTSLPVITGAKYIQLWVVPADDAEIRGATLSNIMICEGTDAIYEPYI